MTATDDTCPTGKNPREGKTTAVEQQLDEVIDLFEAIEWSDVDGLSTREAAALSQRLLQARQQTQRARAATDGGEATQTEPGGARVRGAGVAFDARDVARGAVDDATVRQATEENR